MNLTNNQIAFSLFKSVVITPSNNTLPSKYLKALVAEIAQIGFTFSPEVVAVLKTFSVSEIKAFNDMLIPLVAQATGRYVHFQPLFKNFPHGVPDLERQENEYFTSFLAHSYIDDRTSHDEETGAETITGVSLPCGHIVNAKLHALNLFDTCPICPLRQGRLKYVQGQYSQFKTNLKVINLKTDSQIQETIQNLMQSKTSLSDTHKEAMQLYFKENSTTAVELIPAQFKFKEVMAFTLALVIKHTARKDLVAPHMKTATDILRLVAALNNGDISLAINSNIKLTSSERKLVLSLFNSMKSPLEDCLRYRAKWLRLGEYLHVGAYQKNYPQAFQYMQALRENYKTIPTFNKQAHKITLQNKVSTADLEFLATRPGEFMRRIDVLCRKTNPDLVVETLANITSDVSTPMLLRLAKYFSLRSTKAEFRAFVPKGDMAKLFFMEEDKRKPLSEKTCQGIIAELEDALFSRFSEQGELKNVFIDPKLQNYLIPLTQRSASKNLETIERGSIIPYDNQATTLRMFIYWKQNPGSRVDVDLSAVGYDENWKQVAHLSFYSLASLGSSHSGDITSAPHGASEFIDINLDKFKEKNIRYVTMNIINFTSQKYNTFECFAGIMERTHTDSAEVFDPKTVKYKFDLAGDSNSNMPLILDIESGNLIWCDMSLGDKSGRTVGGANTQIVRMGRYILSLKDNRPNLAELFSRHAEARGAVIHSKKDKNVEYDLVADENKAKDFAEIVAKWI